MFFQLCHLVEFENSEVHRKPELFIGKKWATLVRRSHSWRQIEWENRVPQPRGLNGFVPKANVQENIEKMQWFVWIIKKWWNCEEKITVSLDFGGWIQKRLRHRQKNPGKRTRYFFRSKRKTRFYLSFVQYDTHVNIVNILWHCSVISTVHFNAFFIFILSDQYMDKHTVILKWKDNKH